MSKTAIALVRSWSMGIVFCIIGSVLSGFLRSEPGRAFASILCLALLIHSWLMQRRYTRTPQRLVFLTLVFCLPTLASLWLGLNVIRFYSYAPESEPNLYSTVCGLQEVIAWCALAVGMVVVFWTIVDLACWLAKRIPT